MKLVPFSAAELDFTQAAAGSNDAVVVWTGDAAWPAPEALQAQIACAAELAVRGFVAVLAAKQMNTNNWSVLPGPPLHAYGRKVTQLFAPGKAPGHAEAVTDYVFWRPGTRFPAATTIQHPLEAFVDQPQRLAVV